MPKENPFIPYRHMIMEPAEMIRRSREFYQSLNRRRSLREFSDRNVPQEVIENIIKTASTAPSGAHKQPWVFCAVRDSAIKKQIRDAAEKEEFENYHGRMSGQWLKDLEPFDTNEHKPFLETAPWLIIVCKKVYDIEEEEKKTNYYVNESVGIACGFLLAAIHNAGLTALTHTPSPMNFLTKILSRPSNERPYLLIPVGYPAENAQVPNLRRKALEDVMVVY